MSRAAAPAQQEQEHFLQETAATLRRRGWQSVALLLLEAGRPLALVAGQLLYIAQPALSLVWPDRAIGRLAHLLEDPVAVQSLIDYLDAEETHG